MPTLSPGFSKYKWKSITSGQHHTIALSDDGKVYALGRKEYGRLGLGKDCEDATELQLVGDLKDKKIVNVACGSATSFAVTEEGEKCICLIIKVIWRAFCNSIIMFTSLLC